MFKHSQDARRRESNSPPCHTSVNPNREGNKSMKTLELPGTRQVFPIDAAGCWYDSHRGWTIDAAIISDAVDRGYTLPVEALEDWLEYDDDANSSYYSPWENFWQDRGDFYDIANEAEQYLNIFAPEGYWISYQDGDFGMYEITEGDF